MKPPIDWTALLMFVLAIAAVAVGLTIIAVRILT